MADVHRRASLGRAAVIAIGFAVVALVTSIVAVVVVVTRATPPAAAPVAQGPQEQTVAAADVTKLKRDVVAKATDARGAVIGVTIKDDALRTALGLAADDVITAIGGRAIKREFDVYDAVLGMSMMDTSIVYVDLVRGGTPALVRWKLDGDLRAARRDPPRRTTAAVLGSLGSSSPDPFGGGAAGSIGGLGGLGTRDPLLDTITKLDDLHYEVPRATIDQLLANPMAFSRQARIVPSYRSGQPDGLKLYAIRPGSLWSTLGIANGDTIQTVNGHALSSPDGALEIYTKVRDATKLEVGVRRRGGGDEQVVTITVK